jgi:sterol desaturase/sphingolipid hydroxylase (fatty acid hydroxylase superfamily)
MIETVSKAMEASIFVRFPGFVWAPIMLIGASAFTLGWRAWRGEAQPTTFWQLLDQTFALSGWRSKSAVIDVFLYLSRLVLPPLASNALAFALAGAFVWGLTRLGLVTPSAQPGASVIVAVAILLVVLFDLGDYCAHRALHRVPILWELHKVHHSATFLSPVTSFRVHPLEALVYTACHSLTIAPVLGAVSFFYRLNAVDLIDLMFTTNLAILVLTFNHLKHSHVQISLGPLDYVLISPHMHQLHHSSRLEHWDKNLGLIFSVWDWTFGTAVREDTKVPVVYGIGRGPQVDAQYTSLYGVFLRPVVNMVLMAIGRLAAEARPSHEFGRFEAAP